jgi:hypothetical protein
MRILHSMFKSVEDTVEIESPPSPIGGLSLSYAAFPVPSLWDSPDVIPHPSRAAVDFLTYERQNGNNVWILRRTKTTGGETAPGALSPHNTWHWPIDRSSTLELGPRCNQRFPDVPNVARAGIRD